MTDQIFVKSFKFYEIHRLFNFFLINDSKWHLKKVTTTQRLGNRATHTLAPSFPFFNYETYIK